MGIGRDGVSLAPVASSLPAIGSGHGSGTAFAELSFVIPSNETAVVALVEIITQAMKMLSLEEDKIARTELCFQEALLNAHFHGNQGDPHREIRVRCLLSNPKIELHVEDEGPGHAFEVDGCEIASTKTSGRGLFLIRHLMDSVAFNSSGNHIVMSLIKEPNDGDQRYPG